MTLRNTMFNDEKFVQLSFHNKTSSILPKNTILIIIIGYNSANDYHLKELRVHFGAARSKESSVQNRDLMCSMPSIIRIPASQLDC